MKEDYLEGKKILIVDDEQDVLETLEELLTMCEITKTSNFEEAKAKLEKQDFDIAILDIMGVAGYKLLDITKKKNIIAIMLTAHALSTEDTIKSYKSGAASYVPKEKLDDIKTYLNDIMEAKEKGKHFWWRWLERFSPYYVEKFGPEWQKDDKTFWEEFPRHI
jgi:DNA-binding NtrC family response regulator